MSSVSSAPSLTASSPAETSRNAIPNLHGGAHPATPKLAGIICGSCILFAWTVCLIYWLWQRHKETQDIKEVLANEKAGIYDPKRPRPLVHPSRRRAAADRLERIESLEKHEKERHQKKRELKEADERARHAAKHADGPLIPNGPGANSHSGAPPVASTSGHVPGFTHHQLTPTMEEVATSNE